MIQSRELTAKMKLDGGRNAPLLSPSRFIKMMGFLLATQTSWRVLCEEEYQQETTIKIALGLCRA